MEDFEYEADHVKHSIGGRGGHIFRRFFHVGMVVFPWLYFEHGEAIADVFSQTPVQFAAMLGFVAFFAELLRMRWGLLIVGQREYEANQISALGWGAFAVCLALILAPQEGGGLEAGKYTIPLICGLTFVDPVMGEVKRAKKGMKNAILIGLIVSYSIWLASVMLFSTPLLAAVLLAPLTVAGEVPRLTWIDDNATMILFPLIPLLLAHWIF